MPKPLQSRTVPRYSLFRLKQVGFPLGKGTRPDGGATLPGASLARPGSSRAHIFARRSSVDAASVTRKQTCFRR